MDACATARSPTGVGIPASRGGALQTMLRERTAYRLSTEGKTTGEDYQNPVDWERRNVRDQKTSRKKSVGASPVALGEGAAKDGHSMSSFFFFYGPPWACR